MDPSEEMHTCKDTQNFIQADMTITKACLLFELSLWQGKKKTRPSRNFKFLLTTLKTQHYKTH